MEKEEVEYKKRILVKLTTELIDDAHEMMKNKMQKVINSGAVDIEKYEENYLLPREILYALCMEVQYQYLVESKKYIEESKNIFALIPHE